MRGHTVKVFLVEGRHDVDAVRRHVAARLGAEPRLRQRLAPTPLGLAPPAWVDDPSFDLIWHVRARPFRATCGAWWPSSMVEALDRRRPLWRMDVASPVEGDCTAIVWRVHHCMADGGTVMRMATRDVPGRRAESAASTGGGVAPRREPPAAGLVLGRRA